MTTHLEVLRKLIKYVGKETFERIVTAKNPDGTSYRLFLELKNLTAEHSFASQPETIEKHFFGEAVGKTHEELTQEIFEYLEISPQDNNSVESRKLGPVLEFKITEEFLSKGWRSYLWKDDGLFGSLSSSSICRELIQDDKERRKEIVVVTDEKDENVICVFVVSTF
jgi:hypothetical protein